MNNNSDYLKGISPNMKFKKVKLDRLHLSSTGSDILYVEDSRNNIIGMNMINMKSNSFPFWIFHLKELKVLYLNYNIVDIPYDNCFRKLNVISLKDNKIESIIHEIYYLLSHEEIPHVSYSSHFMNKTELKIVLSKIPDKKISFVDLADALISHRITNPISSNYDNFVDNERFRDEDDSGYYQSKNYDLSLYQDLEDVIIPKFYSFSLIDEIEPSNDVFDIKNDENDSLESKKNKIISNIIPDDLDL